MRLVLRRARGAKSLLLAATGATLIATALLTGLAGYSRAVVDSGADVAISSASPEERSILVRGSAGGNQAELEKRDAALRERFAGGFSGVPTTVSGAGVAAGRQLAGPTGTAVPDDDGVVFASVLFLDDLAAHADLVSGAWPSPGAQPVQTTLAEPVATILGVKVGDQIPVTDRVTRKVTPVRVVGVWKPRDGHDPYWRLAPDVMTGAAPGSATYGPLVVDRTDFLDQFLANASVAWLVEPNLDRITVGTLHRLGQAAKEVGTTLPSEVGLGSSGLVTTQVDQLADRLGRAELVGRSALVTPMLLVVVLGGYALLLVALLLTEQRRDETSLLRARGAGRGQLVGLAIREALLVVLPAVVLGPVLSVALIGVADRTPLLTDAAIRLSPRPDSLTWLVAGLAVVGCLLAMTGPALRRGGTYVGDLAARSRPSRRTAVQRAGLDVALIALAVLGWFQLRQYSSPLVGAGGRAALGIDPLLAATPTIGVLAGAVLALRALPPLARLVERTVDRRSWTAMTFGMWQAGRRPHAGPVLLLSLAVAVSTLAWCLAATSDRSLTDQADHQVGADLRLVEASGEAPPERAGQLAELSGATGVLPAWRDELRLGTEGVPAELLALPSAMAGPVVRYRADLAGGDPDRVFDALAASPVTAPTAELPAGTRRLTGQITTATGYDFGDTPPEDRPRAADAPEAPINSAVVLVDTTGAYHRIPLGQSQSGKPLRFSIELAPGTVRLAGFAVDGFGTWGYRLDWHLTDLRAGTGDQAGTPLSLGENPQWRLVNRQGVLIADPNFRGAQVETAAGEGTLSAGYLMTPTFDNWTGARQPWSVAITPAASKEPVPVVATTEALAALRMNVGTSTQLTISGISMTVKVVGTVAAVPGVPEGAALLADLPSLNARLFHDTNVLREAQEWWVGTRAGQTGSVVGAAAAFDGLRIVDRREVADQASSDPYGVGARVALFAAALGAILLAAVGVGVDIRATARRRLTELAVLRTLGTRSRTLTRSLLVEQGFLAGLGVLVGLAVGIGVAATMAPLIILTPAAERPVPVPLLEIAWLPSGGTALVLLLLAMLLSGLTAVTTRNRLAAAQLRIGDDR
ncbi:FtsX-like permease family protein [Plantactinospora sp. B5E13]|uniref:FtsX-like permease family protein n=1 Tax=Plantactinospora sp. B5E13 TaxID=3153758 RepID=UPI00325C5E8A